MQSLAMNHPFVDGNKRVAFALTAIFLKLNGLSLKVDAKSGVDFVEVTLIKERAPLSVITSWIEKQSN
jgi:death-on-curing protein